MKNYNKILEAVNRGIKFALDDFDNSENIQGLTNSKVNHQHGTKEWLDLMNNIVDLGLPSGTLWCKYNLGCNWEKLNNDSEYTKPEDWYGKYYAWGETSPKKGGSWDNYKFGNEKYKFKYNIQDGLGELLLEDDAAYLYDNRFKMPTYKLCKELSDNTHSILIKNYNPNLETLIEGDNHGINKLNGIAIISNINGNHIFVPYIRETTACFWSSTLTKNQPKCNTACFLNMDGFWNHGRCFTSNSNRCNNIPIRPVINL